MLRKKIFLLLLATIIGLVVILIPWLLDAPEFIKSFIMAWTLIILYNEYRIFFGNHGKHTPTPSSFGFGKVYYKYCNLDSAIKIIRGAKLLYQSPTNFNDPFDSYFGLIDLEYVSRTTGFDAKEFIRKCAINTGILCLSKNNKQILMWSHYADKHNGLCLGFTNPGYPDEEPYGFFDVQYTNEIVPQDYFYDVNSRNSAIAQINMFCTKSKVWEYEEEVRVFKFGKVGLQDFLKRDLAEVYFGINTPQKEIDMVIQLLHTEMYPVRKVGKMKINDSKFELDIEKIDYVHPFDGWPGILANSVVSMTFDK